MTDSIKVFETSFTDFQSRQDDLNKKIHTAKTRLSEDFDLLDDCAKEHNSQLQIYYELKNMIKDIKEELTNDQDTINPIVRTKIDDYDYNLNNCKKQLDKIRDSKPSYGNSKFIRFVLGRVNCKVWKDNDRVQMRNEYTKFKGRTTYIFILFPLIQLFFYHEHFIWKIHQMWLLYYYMTLALRENILLINGSNIKSWWLYHHYISILITMVLIGWPDQDIYNDESIKVNYFLLMQGLVMFMQHKYQKKRKYVRVSMGKAKKEDLDSTETLEEKPNDLKLLVPLLFIIYLSEFFFGTYLIHKAINLINSFETLINSSELWGKIIFGTCMLTLAIGNFYTTIGVLYLKRQNRKLDKKLRLKRLEKKTK